MVSKINVIMLTYNREQLISKAIESILSQTFEDFEYIIVDNGSTDASGEIADSYAAKDSRVKVIHRKRGSIGSGRNTGLDIATGEYITFIDDDDYAEPDMLEFLHTLVQTYHADIAACGSYKIENGKALPNIIYDELHIMDAVQAMEAFLRRKLYSAGLPAKLVRRSLFDKIRFFENGTYEDIRTSYRLFSNANLVAAYGIPKYYALRHPGNNSDAATKHEMLNPTQLEEYLTAFHERTEYIHGVLPQLGNFALYSEWSYMISMVEKIHRFGLMNCDKPLEFMQNELLAHYQEFFSGPYIEGFEKDWMKQYITEG